MQDYKHVDTSMVVGNFLSKLEGVPLAYHL